MQGRGETLEVDRLSQADSERLMRLQDVLTVRPGLKGFHKLGSRLLKNTFVKHCALADVQRCPVRPGMAVETSGLSRWPAGPYTLLTRTIWLSLGTLNPLPPLTPARSFRRRALAACSRG